MQPTSPSKTANDRRNDRLLVFEKGMVILVDDPCDERHDNYIKFRVNFCAAIMNCIQKI
jgi:hypothetical protein